MAKKKDIQKEVVEAVKPSGHVFYGVLEALNQALEPLPEGEPLEDMVTRVTAKVFEGVAEVGGQLEEAAAALMTGWIQICQQKKLDVHTVLGLSAFIFMKHTAQVRGNVGTVARALIAGAVNGAKETGIKPEETAVEAAAGALSAAGLTTEEGRIVNQALAGSMTAAADRKTRKERSVL